jgi:ABC-2 type transport system ATP-binding protein
MEVMIYTEDLTKHFDDFVAVDGVNLNVSAGEVMVLLGPNGAGKTTTVRMLTSILIPTRGRAEVAGYDVIKHPDKVRASVGVLTEHHGLYNRMNAQEYLMFYGRLYSFEPKAMVSRIDQLLDRFELSDVRFKRLGEYSKGMRQKLSLVRALLHNPPVLLLDEPTSALDPENSRLVRNMLHTLRDGNRAILLCTHNLAEAEELADKVAIIRRGHIIFNDTLSNLKFQFLGPKEYEACLANKTDSKLPVLPVGVVITSQGDNWLRFRVQDPEHANPHLIQAMLDCQLEVVSFNEVPQSLEEAYLAANNRVAEQEKASHA